jgi:hypothetical protein
MAISRWSPYPADVFALERTYALRKAYGGKPYRSLGVAPERWKDFFGGDFSPVKYTLW